MSEPLRVTVPVPDMRTPQEGQGVTVYVMIASNIKTPFNQVIAPAYNRR